MAKREKVVLAYSGGLEPDLMKIAETENELSAIIGRKVDLVERKAVERSENYIRRRHILRNLEMIYVA